MARALPVPESWNVAQVGSFVAVAAAQRNYQPRRCLGGAKEGSEGVGPDYLQRSSWI